MLFFEGIGEDHLYKIVSSILRKEGLIAFEPNTVRNVDYLAARDVIIIEVEDTIFESYTGTKQLIKFASYTKIYNAFYVLVVPLPADPIDAKFPIIGFFARTRREGILKRELWFIYAKGEIKLVRIVMKDSPRLKFKYLKDVIEIDNLEPKYVYSRILKIYERNY